VKSAALHRRYSNVCKQKHALQLNSASNVETTLSTSHRNGRKGTTNNRNSVNRDCIVGQHAARSSNNGHTAAVHEERTNELTKSSIMQSPVIAFPLVPNSLLSSRALCIINTLFPQRKRPHFILTQNNDEYYDAFFNFEKET